MSIDQYPFPFRQAGSLEYATIRPLIFSTFEVVSEKTKLGELTVPNNTSAAAINRIWL
jgi:hypothetical protein